MTTTDDTLARPARSLRRTLGKGLGALLGEAAEDYAQLDKRGLTGAGTPESASRADSSAGAKTLPIEWLSPGPFQPRRVFKADALDSLAESIRQRGILQPIVVRREPARADAYQIIAGERRWRAAQKAGLHEVPVLVRDITDAEALEISIIENVQREDLSPLEEAEGYQRLIAEFHHTHEDVGRIVGKSRTHITNTLRLMKLPDAIKTRIDSGEISPGHARAIMAAGTSEELMYRILNEGLSVRDAEDLARTSQAALAKKPRAPRQKDPNTAALERDLSAALGLAVKISGKGSRGVITIRYQTLDQLDDLSRRLASQT